MEVLEQYQNTIALGIFMNLVSTFGFGIYKTASLTEDQAVYLVDKYQAKIGFSKLMLLWFMPFYGFLYVFKEVVRLQFGYINKGFTVFNYIEDNLKKRGM